MHLTPLQLITIIAEPVLEERLTGLLRSLGASGFTVTESRGEGSRGIRAGPIPGSNVRIESIAGREVVDAVLRRVAADFFPHYAVIAFVQEVGVVRGEKYVR